MANIPSGALAGAAVSAVALARIVAAFARRLPVPTEIALAAVRTCRGIETVTAARVQTAADVSAIGVALVTTLQAIAGAAEPGDAAGALYEAAGQTLAAHPVSASPVLTEQYTFARALCASIEVTCLGEAFLCEALSAFTDRRAAESARTRINAACDAAGDRIAALLGEPAYAVLAEAARQASVHLVDRATSLQPVVRVRAMRSFPSTALAWSLYGDPVRADELVRRNRVGTPLFMPATIEAVSPKAS